MISSLGSSPSLSASWLLLLGWRLSTEFSITSLSSSVREWRLGSAGRELLPTAGVSPGSAWTGEEVAEERGAAPQHLLQRLQAGRHDVVVPVL